MKKLISLMILLIISNLSAEVLSGKTLEKGKWSIFYESSSQTVAGSNKRKFMVNKIKTIGFKYGVNDGLTIGYESSELSLENFPEKPSGIDLSIVWKDEGKNLGSVLLECALFEINDFNFKAQLKHLLPTRKLIFSQKGISGKSFVEIKDHYSLMFIVSKAITSKLNIAGSMDFCSLKVQADDDLKEYYNDTDKSFVRWALGMDYCLAPDFIVYLYSAHAMNSSAVGSHDSDVDTSGYNVDDRIIADNYGILKAGLQYMF